MYGNLCLSLRSGIRHLNKTNRFDIPNRNFSSWLDNFLYRINPFHKPLVTGKLTNLDKDYKVIEKLGFGRYGEVFSACRRDDPSCLHAVKTIPKSRVMNIYELRNEIDLLFQLNHPNIIRIIKIYEEVHTIHIVTELCTGGELFERIISKGKVSEIDACRYTRQILDALRYCHGKNVVHRDIKPENILFRSMEPDSPICLVDFGLARIFHKDELMSANVGSPTYIAPEVLEMSYTEKCDLWSTGVILYMLLSGETPFPGETEDEILENVKKGNYKFRDRLWVDVSEEAIDLVALLLQVDPVKRISAEDALNHPWIMNDGGKREEPLVYAFQNIQSFNSHRKLKRAALGFIAEHLLQNDNDEMKRLKSIFEKLDTDKDGLLSVEEVVGAIKSNVAANRSENTAELESMVRSIDADKSGMIDIDEFLQAAMKQALYLKESSISAAFEKFDVDGKGSINRNDLISIFGTESNVDNIMKEVDLNEDGVIDYKEFAIAVRNKEREDVLRPRSVGEVARKLRRLGKIN